MAQLLSSKNLLLSTSPLVVGAVSTVNCFRSLADGGMTGEDCDLLELRLDSLDLPPDEIRRDASKLSLPCLITARHPEEGGDRGLGVSERTALLEAHLPLAVLMDVELRSVSDLLPLVRKAQAAGIQVIGSFHDFHATPGDDVLQGAVDFALQFKLDGVKVATTLQGPADLARLIALLGKERRLPLSVMGMGSLGRVSRLALARCGSILNYGYLGVSNAPGQWPARRLKELLTEL